MLITSVVNSNVHSTKAYEQFRNIFGGKAKPPYRKTRRFFFVEQEASFLHFRPIPYHTRYPKEIMKMEQHFSTLQRWLQK